MKKMFSIVPFAFVLFAGHFNALQPEVATNVYARTGSRGADCSGSGICTISTSDGQAPPADGFKATMGYDAQGQIFLEFKYADLSSTVIATQFQADVFEMQSDCPVPVNVLQAIGAKGTVLTLSPGLYPLIKSSQAVRITFE
jgi:hypothetical protein